MLRRSITYFEGTLLPSQIEYLKKFRQRVQTEEGPDPVSFPPTHTLELTREGQTVTVVKPHRGREPLPPWLRLKLPQGPGYKNYIRLKNQMREKKLATVCEEAKCPNIGECWGGDGDSEVATATIMLMGDECTRGCRFCSVKTRKQPKPLDPDEPRNVALALRDIGVDYIVMTMVDRDDISDGGAHHVAQTIQEVQKANPNLLIECLVGDFRGRAECIDVVARSGLNVYAHNIECVERITPWVRDRRATYRQSLEALRYAKVSKETLYTKSSLMLGLGEKEAEIRQALIDLRDAGVDFVTLGQYLQPSSTRMKVERYVHPDEFENWKVEGEKLGFRYIASGPMVRSSYRAGEFFISNVLKLDKKAAEKHSI